MKINIVWHRRDLRVFDNTSLYHAMTNGGQVYPIFILDDNILQQKSFAPAQVAFMLESLNELSESYKKLGLSLIIERGTPLDRLQHIANQIQATDIFFNEDYEPPAKKRDQEVITYFQSKGVRIASFKDHVIFAGKEVLNLQGLPYTIFTPYKNKWLSLLMNIPQPPPLPKQLIPSQTQQVKSYPFPSAIEELDNRPLPPIKMLIGGEARANQRLKKFIEKGIATYNKTRDFPSLTDGTSKLSADLRFGTISIRVVLKEVLKAISQTQGEERVSCEVFLSELIWRDFFSQILDNFPYVETQAFLKKRQYIQWENNHALIETWKQGNTGFPIIDAGMRELNQTGWMHNRVRMITSSFLTKILHVDWRIGEAYFMEKLIDGDMASNNGGWQWAASTGADPKPMRIFSPALQTEKYDKIGEYIKTYIPELKDADGDFLVNPEGGGFKYPPPIVDYKQRRTQAIELYKKAE